MNIKYLFIATVVLLNIQISASQRLVQMLMPGKRVVLGGISKWAVVPRRSISTSDVFAYYTDQYKQSEQELKSAQEEVGKAWQRYYEQKRKHKTLEEMLALMTKNNPSLVATRVNNHTAYIDIPGKGRSYFPA